jgi:DNA-binding MarR family transcriptional regulator
MNQLPTAQQKRLLRLMLNGDLIWEVAGKSYRSIYNERLSRQQRVPASTVEEMEQQGWIRRLDNPNSSRLDGWEMTEQGRAFAAQLRLEPGDRRSRRLPLFRSDCYRAWRDVQAHVDRKTPSMAKPESWNLSGA